jgi:hypothetical protein
MLRRLAQQQLDSMAPTKANGSAKMVCSNLTSDTNRRAITVVVTGAPWVAM